MHNLPLAPFARFLHHDPGFQVIHESDSDLHLAYDLGRADIQAVSVGHTLDEVTLEIPSGRSVLLAEKQNDVLPEKAHSDQDDFVGNTKLKWSTCAAHELFEFFANHLIYTVKIREHWIEFPLAMVRGLVSELCSRRDMQGFDLNAESFRRYLPLKSYQTLLDETQSDMPTDGQSALSKYLGNFSKIETADGIDWSPQAYEVHGNSVMQLLEVFPVHLKAESRVLSHPVDRQIIGFRSEIINEMVVIKISFAD